MLIENQDEIVKAIGTIIGVFAFLAILSKGKKILTDFITSLGFITEEKALLTFVSKEKLDELDIKIENMSKNIDKLIEYTICRDLKKYPELQEFKNFIKGEKEID